MEKLLNSIYCKISDFLSAFIEYINIKYTTTFQTQVITEEPVVPVFPANTKEVLFMNNSDCAFTLTTNKGTQSVLPYGQILFKIHDYEAPITFTSISKLSGLMTVGDYIMINYKMVV